MSLVKLAYSGQKNRTNNVNLSSSKTINAKNIAAVATGGTLGFAAKEAVEHIKGFNKLNMSHRYASRMASVAGGLLGAGSIYAFMEHKKEEKTPSMYML